MINTKELEDLTKLMVEIVDLCTEYGLFFPLGEGEGLEFKKELLNILRKFPVMKELIDKVEPLDPTMVYILQLNTNSAYMLGQYQQAFGKAFPDRRFLFLSKNAKIFAGDEEWLKAIRDDLQNIKNLK